MAWEENDRKVMERIAAALEKHNALIEARAAADSKLAEMAKTSLPLGGVAVSGDRGNHSQFVFLATPDGQSYRCHNHLAEPHGGACPNCRPVSLR